MNYIRHLTAFFGCVAADDRLSPTHVSLYMALFQAWNSNRFRSPVSVTRAEMMRLSKICSSATYHKCIKDLQHFGYIGYTPSHHPLKGSSVELFDLGTGVKQVEDDQSIKKQSSTEQLHHIDNINSINKTGVNGTRIPTDSKNEQVKESSMLIPFLEEVRDYFRIQDYPVNEAERFYNYYSSNGWTVGGKARMKNWQAAARNWVMNIARFNKSGTPRPQQLHTNEKKNYHEPL